MFFSKTVDKNYIMRQIEFQITNLLQVSDKGIDVVIVAHKDRRSNNQNRFLMVVLSNIIKFHCDTGFLPSGCLKREMRTDSLKEYWKERLGVCNTSKLSTKEMSEFVDKIQATMIMETGGEYEAISPNDDYLDGLVHSMM